MPRYKVEWSADVDATDPVAALDVARAKVNQHAVPARVYSAGGVLISPRDDAPPADYVLRSFETYGNPVLQRPRLPPTREPAPSPRISRSTLQGWALLAAFIVCLWFVGNGVIR